MAAPADDMNSTGPATDAAHHGDDDAGWMRLAIEVGARGGPEVRPNPQVGCVIVRAGVAVGIGWHRRCGGPHAEVEALAAAGPAARGATAYVTLEPCNHHGRTPPCSEALIAAGVRRVVCAVRDPNPQAAGGLEHLRASGVETVAGVEAEPARSLLEVFEVLQRERRAFVQLKMAATLDGLTAAIDGSSQWLTGPASRRRVHQMRAAADAVLVGSGTALADDPRLDARDVGATRSPWRIVVDRRLRLPVSAALCDVAIAPTRVYTTIDAASGGQAALLRDRGVEVVGLAQGDDWLRRVLQDLHQRGQHALLCEGGATLAAALWRQGMVDRLEWMVGPKLLGQGRGLWPDLGVGNLAEALRLTIDSVELVGGDLHVRARPDRARAPHTQGG